MSFHVADADKNLVHGALILRPKPGKIDELVDALGKYAAQVEAEDPDVYVFSVARSEPSKEVGQSGPEVVTVTMVFKDKAAAEKHRESASSKAFQAASESADRLESPPEIRTLTPTGGFMRKPPQ